MPLPYLLEVEGVEVQAGRAGGEQRPAHLRAMLHPERLHSLLVSLAPKKEGMRKKKEIREGGREGMNDVNGVNEKKTKAEDETRKQRSVRVHV